MLNKTSVKKIPIQDVNQQPAFAETWVVVSFNIIIISVHFGKRKTN